LPLFFKVGIGFHQSIIIHDISGKTEGKQGLYTAGTSGDNAQCAGGRNGGGGGVPIGAFFSPLKTLLSKIAENASLFRQLSGCFMGFFLNDERVKESNLERIEEILNIALEKKADLSTCNLKNGFVFTSL